MQGGTGLGLFGTNEGSITKVTLENAQVSGKNSVGSFCGVNKGKVEELTTIGAAFPETRTWAVLWARMKPRAKG